MDVIKDQSWIRFVPFISPFFIFYFSRRNSFLYVRRTDGRTGKALRGFKREPVGFLFLLNDELKSFFFFFFFKKKEGRNLFFFLKENTHFHRGNWIWSLNPRPASRHVCVVCTAYNVQLDLLIFDVFRQLPDVRPNMNLRRPRGIILPPSSTSTYTKKTQNISKKMVPKGNHQNPQNLNFIFNLCHAAEKKAICVRS